VLGKYVGNQRKLSWGQGKWRKNKIKKRGINLKLFKDNIIWVLIGDIVEDRVAEWRVWA
jgi:hypothetical protein